MKQVFIIHGWTYDLDKWDSLVGVLRSHGIEPVQLRVPGLTAPSKQVWDIDGYIDWLGTQLAGSTKPVVIGHSNGGRIALSFIQKYPNKIDKLILIDSAGIVHQATKARAKLSVLRGVAKVGKPLGKLPVVKKAFYRVIGAQDYLNAPPNMKKTMQNMLSADQQLKLSTIKLPTTIIWGRDDSITPLADGKELEDGIKGSRLHIIDGARHAPFYTHPEAVADIIIDALKVSA